MVYSKPFRTIKNRVRKGKMGVKNLLFSSKKQVFGLQKLRASNQTRKAKRYKMQALFLKTDKTRGVKGKK